jgi:Outer membrane protein beta-barrel domain
MGERTLRNSLLAWLPILALFASGPCLAHGQAKYTATRAGDLQLGAGYTNGNSDYVPNRIAGYSGYATFDFKEHFGTEFDFHQAKDPKSDVYERSYEWGVRYLRHYGNDRYRPYVRVMFGRGVFNFPGSVANLAYNMIVAAGGMDIEVHRRINVRAEFEYQDWLSGPGITNGLAPTLINVGVAYHFPAGNPH